MTSLVRGFFYFISGIGLLFRPGIFRYALWPLLINLGIFVVLGVLAFYQFGVMLDALLSCLPGWLEWLRYLLWPLFALALLLAVFFTFSILANLIAAPFNARLAYAVEQRYGRPSVDSAASAPLMRSLWQAVHSEVRKMIYILLRAVPILVLFVVPVVNIGVPVLWFVFSAWMLAIEYMDYPLGNHDFDFRSQLSLLKQRRLVVLGFGATVTLALLVPILNFIVMPAAVAGASKLWLQEFDVAR